MRSGDPFDPSLLFSDPNRENIAQQPRKVHFSDPKWSCWDAASAGLHSRAVTTLSTKADDIARVLEDEIVGGGIAPGTVMRQEQLSERFEVSRTPVREALRRLAALGLVSFEPNRGVRVRSISPAELREAYLVRAELESLATEVATPRMTAADLASLDAAERRF